MKKLIINLICQMIKWKKRDDQILEVYGLKDEGFTPTYKMICEMLDVVSECFLKEEGIGPTGGFTNDDFNNDLGEAIHVGSISAVDHFMEKWSTRIITDNLLSGSGIS